MYEMLTGRRAFIGETGPDTMTAILKEEPKSVRSLSADVPLELERLVDRCLEKQAEQRFQTSKDMAYSLRSILTHVEHRKAFSGSRLGWAALGAVCLIAIVAGLLYVSRPRQGPVDPIDSIAVLPFVNASGDPEQEYFVDGMTEALIGDLAKIRALKVISRTSAMQFKGVKKPLPEIARELKVEAVVEGSVLRGGDRVRITARLIHAATEKHLWSEKYERDLRDVLTLQGEVAQTIAQEIRVTLTPQEQSRMAAARPVNPAAYEAYVKGRFYWNKRTTDGFKKAVEYFDQTVALDPAWPLGYAGLADAHGLMSQYAPVRPSESIPKAKAAVAKALEMDESLAEAHASLAWIAFTNDWDWPTAEREFERALALSPNYATGHMWYAVYFLHMGRRDEALKEITKAKELDPLSLIIGAIAGRVHCYAGDFAQAETCLRKTLELGPDYARTHQELAILLLLQGRHAEATTHAREAVRHSAYDSRYVATLGHVCAKAGQAEEARRILDEFAARSKEEYVASSHFALVHAGLDARDRMFEWLEKACQEHDSMLLYTLTSPLLAPMRSDPRFVDLVRRVGLPPQTPPPWTTALGPAQPAKGKVTLAVLPFANDSGDNELDYLSDGIAETLINGFSRIDSMNTVPRSLAFQHRGVVDPVQVGKQLSATAVLSGRVLKRGDSLTVKAELVDVAEGRQLWGDRYQKKSADLVEIEGDIAKAITDALRLRLTGEERQDISRGYTRNAEAYRLYLEGRFWWSKRTKEGFERALILLAEAATKDPSFALAHTGTADVYSLMPMYGIMAPREAFPKAQAAVDRALALEPELAETRTAQGLIRHLFDWDMAKAEENFRYAMQLNPRYAPAHQFLGQCFADHGRFAEAREQVRRAIELDPLTPVFMRNKAMYYYRERNWEASLAAAREGLEIAPEFPWLHQSAGLALLELGQTDEGVDALRRSAALARNLPFATGFLGYGLARAGLTAEARAILATMKEGGNSGYCPPLEIARVYVGLGELDEAMRWLEQAYEARDSWMIRLALDPSFAPLRADPRFDSLLRRVGLAQDPVPSDGK
jgi:TolB-like protein/Flp pilus assembly protein TadD